MIYLLSYSNKTAVALGNFDGLHKGHISVIASALSMRDSGLEPVILLFDEHPQKALGNPPEELIQKKLKIRLLEALGIAVEFICFEEIKDMDCSDFFEKIILTSLNAGAVCCGSNYRFGKDACGDAQTLASLCAQHSVELKISESVEFDGKPISSTRIRRCITGGDIKSANAMLGRAFSYEYTVVGGDRRGRLIGAPTINQIFESGFIVPAFGVYASEVMLDGERLASVTNIGIRPTFGSNELRSETHIIDYSGDLYGKSIEVFLLDRIRGEQKFSSMQELSEQINRDVAYSNSIHSQRGDNSYV